MEIASSVPQEHYDSGQEIRLISKESMNRCGFNES